MDLSKLTYSKEDSARTPADVPLHKATTENKDGSGISETIQVPLAYRKTAVSYTHLTLPTKLEV